MTCVNPYFTQFFYDSYKYNMNDTMRPKGWGTRGPAPKEITTGEIAGIQCGWDKTIVPPDQVYDLAVLGLNNKEIGRFYGVSDATIARNFAAELQKGREMTKIKLRRAMMKNACEHMNASVQIFLAKAILGMTETTAQDLQPLPWNPEKTLDKQTVNSYTNEVQGEENGDT